jgi:predicted helicase
MQYVLRSYQKQASDAAVAAFTSKRESNGLLILPTGAGKSLVIADIAHRLDGPLLILQPSKEILEQNFAKLQSYGCWDSGIYSASVGKKDINCTHTNALADEINNFVDAVIATKVAGKVVQPKVTGEQGLRALELADAICREIHDYNSKYGLYKFKK